MNLQSIIARIKNKISRPTEAETAQTDEIYELSDKRNLFVDSISELTADDIAPSTQKPRSVIDTLISTARIVIMVVCAAVFLASASSLVRRLIDYQRANELYGEIAGSIFEVDLSASRLVSLMVPSNSSAAMPDYYSSLTDDSTDIPAENTYNAKFEQMKANLTYLKSINPDIYGYIHIEGTRISFPIVQGRDNDYYLDRAYNGELLACGAIYADYRNTENILWNRNTVLYGHNMQDGNMFNNVMLFFDEDVFKSSLIEIYTFDGVYTFEPFAIYESSSRYNYFATSFSSDENFVNFCYEMHKNSEVKTQAAFDENDRLITLSTCVESTHPLAATGMRRYVLQGRLIKVEK